MAYRWEGVTFETFAEAAKTWLEWWSEVRAGCPRMVENLDWIEGNTAEEWKKEALRDIQRFHCGRCDSFIYKRHEVVIGRLLEDIKEI